MSITSVHWQATDPGTSWVKDPGVSIGPRVMRLPDGRYRMFYEACDEHLFWRILSATAA